MSLYPTNEWEQAIDSAAATLRADVATLVDDMGADGTDWQPAARRVAGDVASFVRRWHRLDRRSPYRRPVLEEARVLLERVDDADSEGRADLGAERVQLSTLLARLEVSDRLRAAREHAGLSARELARRADVSASYLNELEGSRSGLPTDEVCARLERALGVELAEVVTRARANVQELRAARPARRIRRGQITGTRGDARLTEAVGALAEDATLLELVELTSRLTPPMRRAILGLARDLTDAFEHLGGSR